MTVKHKKHVRLMEANPKHLKGSKPSTLINRALALFGEGGKWWIKGTYHLRKGKKATFHGNNFLGTTDLNEKGQRHIAVKRDMFCSVGALQHINTKREPEAYFYLRVAVAQLHPKRAQSMVYNPVLGKTYATGEGPKVADVVGFNDDNKTKWSEVKKAFKLAAKLAEADGN